MEKTKDILLRGVPKELADKLEKSARDNLRSVNKEAIAILRKAVK